ncbi:MAG: isochorismatase family protein [Candidatus Tectomicrobia bacterium]|uniref:Isochorismatase family protein n=1 Tax=Tectimicrobiota bacterium TaxID=2528274 RepID=A0A932M2G0_UNCTE|nr:isochorismatase family protein [Candidatus Tectomicrobia bacterium]
MEGREMARWLEQVPREEREVYEKAGFGQRQSFGKKLALLVIDCTLAFIGSRQHRSVKDAVDEFHTACGPAGWVALETIHSLLTIFREQGWPVIFTRLDLNEQRASGGATKSARLMDPRGNEIPEEIKPLPEEWVLEKCKASAFFGTPLVTHLVRHGVDSVVVVGVSTSGCVRASAVDAFAHGFKVFLVEEGCFDRSNYAHTANLFDLNSKYADVITFEEFKQMALIQKETVRA